MGQIYEPITKWQVVIRTTYDRQNFEDKVKTLAELRWYFTMFKRRGEVFGYVLDKKRAPHWQDELTTRVEVSIEYWDKIGYTSNSFETLGLFMHHIESHPAIAKCVGYVKKQKAVNPRLRQLLMIP